MMRSRHAAEMVAELDAWVAEHAQLLQVVWREFSEHNGWPEAAELTRRLFGSGVRMRIEDLARDMPPPLGRYDPQTRCVMLTVRGASHVLEARGDCEAFVLVVREAVERYRAQEADARVATAEFSRIADVDADGAVRLEALVAMESWVLLANGGHAGGMQFGLNEAVVFEVADVASVGDYLDAQADAWWPEDGAWLAQYELAQLVIEPRRPLAAGRPAVAPRIATAPSIEHLHPLIATAAAELLAGGHRREAVERAGVVLQDAVQRRSGVSDADGDALMNLAFSPKRPHLAVADLETASGRNVQRGTHLIAQGIVAAIRNPIAHSLIDLSLDEAVEQLSILSFVARRLDEAKLTH